MGDVRVVILTNQDAQFYPLLGPYLARRDLVAALGVPLYDDPGKLWFVAEEEEQMLGFGGLVFNGDEAHFCSDYVRPEHRRQGTHARLVAERVGYAAGRAKRATATATIAGSFAYRRAGFSEARTRRQMKNFIQMERSL